MQGSVFVLLCSTHGACMQAASLPGPGALQRGKDAEGWCRGTAWCVWSHCAGTAFPKRCPLSYLRVTLQPWARCRHREPAGRKTVPPTDSPEPPRTHGIGRWAGLPAPESQGEARSDPWGWRVTEHGVIHSWSLEAVMIGSREFFL